MAVKLSIELNVFDKDGDMTGENKSHDLSVLQIADIIDHAVQLVVMRAGGHDTTAVFEELEEALSSASIVEDESASPTVG